MAKSKWEICLLYIKIYSCTAGKLEPAEDLRYLKFFLIVHKTQKF